MNTGTRFLLTAATLAVGACSTSTPIGIVDTAGTSGGDTGGAGKTGSAGAGSTGGAGAAVTAGASDGTACGPTGIPPGRYVPSGHDVIVEQPFTKPSSVADDWVGYLEGNGGGNDAIKLHFGTDADGNGTLTMVRGMGTAPPPPTDPSKAWPAAIVDAKGQSTGVNSFPDPMFGFAFTARQVTWQGNRLQFVVLAAEPWAPWCALQCSYPEIGPTGMIEGYMCDRFYEDGAPGTCKYLSAPQAGCDLNHEMMCSTSKICSCNDTGCGASAAEVLRYDITFVGAQAMGTGEQQSMILTPAAASP